MRRITFPIEDTTTKEYLEIFSRELRKFLGKPYVVPRKVEISTGIYGLKLLKNLDFLKHVNLKHIESFDSTTMSESIPGTPFPVSSATIWVTYGDIIVIVYEAEKGVEYNESDIYNYDELRHIAVNFALDCEKGYPGDFDSWMNTVSPDWREIANRNK